MSDEPENENLFQTIRELGQYFDDLFTLPEYKFPPIVLTQRDEATIRFRLAIRFLCKATEKLLKRVEQLESYVEDLKEKS